MDNFDTGTQFNFTYAPGTSLEQMMGFEMAGEFWSQYLADDVGMNIFVEMTDYLPENVIGGALPGIEDNVRYETFRNKLKKDITSDLDTLINRNQQDETEKFTAYFSSQFDDLAEGYQVDSNEYMKMTRANAKALDIIDPHDSGLDGYILMRDLDGEGDGDLNDVQWSYNYENDFVPNNSLDFLSVAIHELGHVLGFISGLDQANWLAGKRDVNEDNEDDYYSDLIGNLNNATPVDMLRFSRASYEMSGDDENWIDMSIGSDSYLSFSGSGGQAIAYFASGENTNLGGDGHQASHWKQQNDVLGIMDPVLGLGQRREITQLDLQLFDAIGWDLKTDSTSNVDLETIHTEAKTVLIEKITLAAQQTGTRIDDEDLQAWLEGGLDDDELEEVREAVTILTPDYVDLDGNNYDDRGEQINEMITESGEVYEWGWKGFWWGWKGFWWGWKGFWQNADDYDDYDDDDDDDDDNTNFSNDGFWQNVTWQTFDIGDDRNFTSESDSGNETLDISGNNDNFGNSFDYVSDSNNSTSEYFYNNDITNTSNNNDHDDSNFNNNDSSTNELAFDNETIDTSSDKKRKKKRDKKRKKNKKRNKNKNLFDLNFNDAELEGL